MSARQYPVDVIVLKSTDLACLHVLEVHANLSGYTLAEAEIGGGNLPHIAQFQLSFIQTDNA